MVREGKGEIRVKLESYVIYQVSTLYISYKTLVRSSPFFAYVIGFKNDAIRIKTDSESTDGAARATSDREDREDMANNDPAFGIHLSNKKHFYHTIFNILPVRTRVRLNITSF